MLTAVAQSTMPFLMFGLALESSATPEKFDLPCCSRASRMPYLLCMSVVALLSGVLNSMGNSWRARRSRSFST